VGTQVAIATDVIRLFHKWVRLAGWLGNVLYLF